MEQYYRKKKLSARRLETAYQLASDRIRQYLQAEAEFVATFIRAGDRILELGCGYGRLMKDWARKAMRVTGVDTALESLQMAKVHIRDRSNFDVAAMSADLLGFHADAFDLTACIQNGIAVFQVPPERLVKEALRVTRPGGTVLFSSYSPKIWEKRLEWFRRQADHGLLGPLDEKATRHGTIVCMDGFKATTYDAAKFAALMERCHISAQIAEVDNSSIFCIIKVS